jgi:hypothetical protein
MVTRPAFAWKRQSVNSPFTEIDFVRHFKTSCILILAIVAILAIA